jgi:hypothetical protein
MTVDDRRSENPFMEAQVMETWVKGAFQSLIEGKNLTAECKGPPTPSNTVGGLRGIVTLS